MIDRCLPAPFGGVTVRRVLDAELRVHPPGAVPESVYSWRPSAQLVDEIPLDSAVEFFCYCDAFGNRRFAPVVGAQDYVRQAFAAGLPILARRENLSAEHRNSYRAMSFLFDRGRASHAHLDRRFDASRDLYIRRPGRVAGDERSVLPDDVGLDSNENGTPWTIRELTSRGRELADEHLGRSVSSREAIQHGFWVAAQQRPLHLAHAEVPGLIRDALFELDLFGEPPPESLIEFVEDRLLTAIHAHLDDPQTRFDAWFFPGRGNLAKALARGESPLGGKLSVDDVNRVLAYDAWRSYEYMSGCVHAMSIEFSETLPEPLNEVERSMFRHLYFPTPCYGNLPLVLWWERSAFLRPALTALWERPHDPDVIGALHRLLRWYAQMSRNRREADRRAKRSKRGARQIDLVADRASESDRVTSPTMDHAQVSRSCSHRIYEVIIERRGLCCPRCGSECGLSGELDGEELRSGQPVPMAVWCPHHGDDPEQVATVAIPWGEFLAAANEVR